MVIRAGTSAGKMSFRSGVSNSMVAGSPAKMMATERVLSLTLAVTTAVPDLPSP